MDLMGRDDRDQITLTYELQVNVDLQNRRFTDEEKRMLRPIAETLSLLDGNAFLTMTLNAGREWYEQYLPEACALFEQNGGAAGWAGEVSWIRDLQHETPAVREAYENYMTLKSLSRGDDDAEDNS